MGHTCGLVGFSGALLSGVLRSGCWTFTSKVWFFAEDISSPFRAIVPNVCLLSTFSEKERERQCVGNDHKPSLSACCGWKKQKFIQAQKKKKIFVYVAMAFLAMPTLRNPRTRRAESETNRTRCAESETNRTTYPLETRGTKKSYLSNLSSLHLQLVCPTS